MNAWYSRYLRVCYSLDFTIGMRKSLRNIVLSIDKLTLIRIIEWKIMNLTHFKELVIDTLLRARIVEAFLYGLLLNVLERVFKRFFHG